jgi:tripeptidyl-peptidase-1
MRLLSFRYGLHLTKEQVSELVAPRPETLELVSSWLQYHGMPPSSISTTHGGCWLKVVSVPVSQANELLGASYQLYYHADTNDTILRTVGYALPAALHRHVHTVAPTTAFAPTRLLQQTPRSHFGGAAEVQASAASGNSVEALPRRSGVLFMSPRILRWLYHTNTYVPTETDENVLGISGFQNDYPSPEDLKEFMATFRTDAVDASFTVLKVNHGNYDPNSPGTEGSLDTQYAGAIAYPTPQIFYSVGGNVKFTPSGRPAAGDGYLEWLEYLIDQRKIPQTISITSGVRESIITQEYATALCKLFAHLGLRGTTILVASGDDGVGQANCKDASGRVRFDVPFPASCTSGVLSLLHTGTDTRRSPDPSQFRRSLGH